MDRETMVAIIGAGPAGLACATELVKRRITPVILEQADAVGATWRQGYDRLRLNTSKWFSRLPGSRFSHETPLFPSRDEMVEYLESHARRYELDIRLGTPVERIDRAGGVWNLRTSQGNLRIRHVVVATGLYRDPVIPNWPGCASFRGRILHSSDYQNPGPFAGQSLLVVGAGSSGMEIAQDLSEADARAVYLSVRRPPNILLRTVGGLPGDPAAKLLLKLPTRFADAFMKLMRRITIGDLTAHGLPCPAEGPFERLHKENTSPAVVDRETIDAIRSDRIEVVSGVSSFEPSHVLLSDGRRLSVDTVIAATGFACGLQGLVGHLDVLEQDGTPSRVDGSEVEPGLRFIGFRPVPALLDDAAHQAQRIAREIAQAA